MIWLSVGAAPHCPAGHFSPYSDGEKGAGRNAGAFPATLVIGEIAGDSVPLPVTIRGEDAGRQVRGSADAGKEFELSTQNEQIEISLAGKLALLMPRNMVPTSRCKTVSCLTC